ncbi:MAG: endonuclease domain-containing protein [Pseudonocardiaceae bacterium]
MLADGRIRRLWGVLVPCDLFFDPYTRAAAALLVAGSEAALTGLTAAWLHGCRAAEFGTVHIAVPYARSLAAKEGLVVHQGRQLLADVVELGGLRSVSLEVAVTELLCTDTPRRALAVADQATALIPEGERPAFRFRLATRLGNRPDRRGTARANGLLPLVTGRAESPPESWLKLLVVEAGFPQPVDQFPVADILGTIRYVLDLCWPELRIALEYDGYESHEFRSDADARRDRDLERRGWITVRATAEDLREPAALLDRLEKAFRSRGVVGFRFGFDERPPRNRGGAGRRVERFVAPDAQLG